MSFELYSILRLQHLKVRHESALLQPSTHHWHKNTCIHNLFSLNCWKLAFLGLTKVICTLLEKLFNWIESCQICRSSKEKNGRRRKSSSSGSSSDSSSPHQNRSLSYSPAEKRQAPKETSSSQKSQSRTKSGHHRSKQRSRSPSSDSVSPVRKKNLPKKQSRKSSTRSRSDSRSRSRKNKSRSNSHSARLDFNQLYIHTFEAVNSSSCMYKCHTVC